jgi:hypothetical protein
MEKLPLGISLCLAPLLEGRDIGLAPGVLRIRQRAGQRVAVLLQRRTARPFSLRCGGLLPGARFAHSVIEVTPENVNHVYPNDDLMLVAPGATG